MAKKKKDVAGEEADAAIYTAEDFEQKLRDMGCKIFSQTMFMETGGDWTASKTNDQFLEEIAYDRGMQKLTDGSFVGTVIGKFLGFFGIEFDVSITKRVAPETNFKIRREGSSYYYFENDVVLMTRVK